MTASKGTADRLNQWPTAAAFREARALEPCRRADFWTANAGQDRVGGLFGFSGPEMAFSCSMTPRAKPVSSSGRRRERRAAAQMRDEGKSRRSAGRFMDDAVPNRELRSGVLMCLHVYRYTDTRFSCEPGNEAGLNGWPVLNRGLRAGVLMCVHVYRYTHVWFSCEPGNEAGVTIGRPFNRGPATRWEYLMRLASLRKKPSS